ncbi:hypothetical protein AMK06_PD00159 (plasmid) [Rhizobium sp. N541]|nr:hypothetical protein AMK05_PD00158 [Rhizobium sp. N324]ANM20438.1 hypothetical protein AMK06_PD00159 [Rhizobium sp. N541]ANM26822.1 hypothetical protein AMK07_PD00159 [Rhizobium sp. N941]OYD00228.1 hypothetical protein AMK08_PD00158 [Rhizobium sp. N4311]
MPSPIWHQREEFGFLIGIYSNPGPSNAKIYILDKGIFWGDGGEDKSFLYSEVKLVSVLEGIESVEIIILTDRGKELRIPVSGRDGKYSDCMVMLQFMYRVAADAKKYPYE